MSSRQGWLRGAVLALVGLVLLGSTAYLTVLALQGAGLVNAGPTSVQTHDARPWLIAALAAAVLALAAAAWAGRRLTALERAAGGLTEAERAAREQQEQAEKRLAESERERRRLEQEQRREQDEVGRLVRGWRSQREWNRELREQLSNIQHEHGVLGHYDVREMVLNLTLKLVEAEKGLLLSRGDETPDGRMEVACAAGFEHDPQDSALAQRFAAQVIQRGTTLREDDRGDLDANKRSAADEEVRNLLAIPIYLRDDFHGVIVCANRDQGFESLDEDVLVAVGDHASAVLQNSRLHGELRNSYLATVRMLASVIEVKDPALRGHSEAVSDYVMAVADRLQFEPRRREELIFGSLLHDVGKIGISERILLKPGPLSDEERGVIQLHPRIGFHLVRQIPALESIAPAILHHHERYDGTGYPARLRGEAIPIEARIIAVADAFSAMTTERPYSGPCSAADACAELERCAGGQFDPEVVRLFVEQVRRRPPEQLGRDGATSDPELEVHRSPGEFVLGGGSFGITDSLTLLYSHRHFHETAQVQAQRASAHQRELGVVVARLVDLDAMNRSRGFAAGDTALQIVGDAFRRAAARVDGLAFRVSGCRIGLLAPDLGEIAAGRLATGLSAELLAGPAVHIEAVAWRAGESGERLIERALRTLDALESLEVPIMSEPKPS